MSLRMKIFNITGFQWKIRFLEGGSRTKNQYIGGIAWKGEAWTFWRFKGLGGREVLAKKWRGWYFWGALIPQGTLCNERYKLDVWIWDLTSEICNKNFLGSYRKFGVDWGVLYMPTACDVNADLSITSNFLVIHLPLKSHKHSTEEISRFKFFSRQVAVCQKVLWGPVRQIRVSLWQKLKENQSRVHCNYLEYFSFPRQWPSNQPLCKNSHLNVQNLTKIKNYFKVNKTLTMIRDTSH